MAGDQIAPPDTDKLLPQLLECLTMYPGGKQLPEPLLALLTPTLAQRAHYCGGKDDWLTHLCWDTKAAARLPETVRNLHLEPHPVSNEIEVEEPAEIRYRRWDPETLQCRAELADLGLLVTFLWCMGEAGGNAWRVHDVRAVADKDNTYEWYPSIPEETNKITPQPQKAPETKIPEPQLNVPEDDEDDDDGSYWAQYDATPGVGRTPARTPLQKRSPAPFAPSVQSQSEMDYFNSYGDVQPALDPHDPDEAEAASAFQPVAPIAAPIPVQPTQSTQSSQELPPLAQSETNSPQRDSPEFPPLSHPRSTSPSSVASIQKLEREAEQSSKTEHAIKQHISTDIKNLFRLARAAGIDRMEFERIVKTELEVLPLLEKDD